MAIGQKWRGYYFIVIAVDRWARSGERSKSSATSMRRLAFSTELHTKSFHRNWNNHFFKDGLPEVLGTMSSGVAVFGHKYCPCFLCRRLKKAQSAAPNSGFAGKHTFRVMIIDEP